MEKEAISFETSRAGGPRHHAFGSLQKIEVHLKSTDFRAVPYACRWGVFHQELNRKGILSTAGPRRPLQSSKLPIYHRFFKDYAKRSDFVRDVSRRGPSWGQRRPKEVHLKSTDFRAVPYACRCGVFHQELNRKGILSTGGPRRPLQSSNFDASPRFMKDYEKKKRFRSRRLAQEAPGGPSRVQSCQYTPCFFKDYEK